MKRIMAVSVLALGLAGCNATVYERRPLVYEGEYRGPRYVYRPVAPVYTPEPRPVVVVRPRPRCFTTWDRTPYGLQERRVCR